MTLSRFCDVQPGLSSCLVGCLHMQKLLTIGQLQSSPNQPRAAYFLQMGIATHFLFLKLAYGSIWNAKEIRVKERKVQ